MLRAVLGRADVQYWAYVVGPEGDGVVECDSEAGGGGWERGAGEGMVSDEHNQRDSGGRAGLGVLFGSFLGLGFEQVKGCGS